MVVESSPLSLAVLNGSREDVLEVRNLTRHRGASVRKREVEERNW